MLFKHKWVVSTILCVLCFGVSKGQAAPSKEAAKLQPVKNAILHKVKNALLHRVDSGVFQVQMGKSMDLTENKVLLTFRRFNNTTRAQRDKNIIIYLNGDAESVLPGDRIDLLKHKDTKTALEGYALCFLDYVSLITPKGVPATATFRLHCE